MRAGETVAGSSASSRTPSSTTGTPMPRRTSSRSVSRAKRHASGPGLRRSPPARRGRLRPSTVVPGSDRAPRRAAGVTHRAMPSRASTTSRTSAGRRGVVALAPRTRRRRPRAPAGCRGRRRAPPAPSASSAAPSGPAGRATAAAPARQPLLPGREHVRRPRPVDAVVLATAAPAAARRGRRPRAGARTRRPGCRGTCSSSRRRARPCRRGRRPGRRASCPVSASASTAECSWCGKTQVAAAALHVEWSRRGGSARWRRTRRASPGGRGPAGCPRRGRPGARPSTAARRAGPSCPVAVRVAAALARTARSSSRCPARRPRRNRGGGGDREVHVVVDPCRRPRRRAAARPPSAISCIASTAPT